MSRAKNSTTTRSRTRTTAAVVAAVASVAAMMFVAAPAGAAPAGVASYPTSTFDITYGASYYRGTLTWYNRSVGVTGTFRAVACRRVYGVAWANNVELDYRSSSTWCDTVGTATIPLAADQPGGANITWIYMTDGAGTFLKGQTCYRTAGVCVDGLW
jgi:hypothetical protein